jgi:dephospho-CoA kinase
VVVVGLTGGIGCGKSTVAALLADRGAVVVDADQVARDVVAPGQPAFEALVDHFGPSVVRPDGTLDRAGVAARVFSDPAQLAVLNAITHPAIGAAIGARLVSLESPAAAGRRTGAERPVVLDIPLLTAAARRLYRLAGVIVVDAPVEVAVRRLVEHRGLSQSDAEARIRAQPGREERRRLGDVVVDNGGSLQDLAAAVAPVWQWLTSLEPGSGDDHEH